MTFEIKSYNSDFIEDQVELIWEVSGKWKYNYATSVEQIKKTYSSDSFDPSTRFYAFKGDDMVGYVTAEIKDDKNGRYATLRFPLAKDNDEAIIDALFNKVIDQLKSKDISRVRAPAAKGLGNTVELAEKYGFEPKSTLFIRAREHINDLSYSGKTDDVIEYNDLKHEERLKNLFLHEMNMSEAEGKQWFDWSIRNKKRKDSNDPNMTSWKLIEENGNIDGFSYVLRSDRQPEIGGLYPLWARQKDDYVMYMDRFLSAHIKDLKPNGLEYLRTYLIGKSEQLRPLYEKVGFNFDKFVSYELLL